MYSCKEFFSELVWIVILQRDTLIVYYPIELFPVPAGVGVVERVEGRLGEALNSLPSDCVCGVWGCGCVCRKK